MVISSSVRAESPAPGYKLKRKANGEYVLMGAFYWSEGIKGGIDWRELETEFEPVPERPKHSPSCASLNIMLTVYPPRPAACDCGLEKANGA